MKKYIIEFIGTFFLMLSIVCSIQLPSSFQPIAIGAVLIGMIYGGGHISGAHYNPAVTLAIWIRGSVKTKDIPGYIIAQLVGAILASLIGVYVFNKSGTSPVDMPFLQGTVAEILGTFALAFVILNVAFAKSNFGNSHYGLSIGMTVIGAAYILGGYGSHGCFNPAVALGTWIADINTFQNIIYITIASFIGGAIAALIFRLTYSEEG